MTFGEPVVVHLDEPKLLFGGSHPSVDPKTGLALFGAYSAPKPVINIGVIGDSDTVSRTKLILSKMARPIPGPRNNPARTPDFPGISPSSPFKCKLSIPDKWVRIIKSQEIDSLQKMKTESERIGTASRTIARHMQAIVDRDEVPDVFICAIPEKMHLLCTTGERTKSASRSRQKTKSGKDNDQQSMLNYFSDEDREKCQQEIIDEHAKNFHHTLKAQTMRIGPRTQMIKPSTLKSLTLNENGSGQKKQEDEATFAWNLATALLYKSECKLWTPAHMPSDVCFVGVSFYVAERQSGGKMGTSLAQVFTPEGEGLVMRGDEFPWASGDSPHLDSSPAENLLKKAIHLYERQTDRLPHRVVLHKTSKFTDDELEGFKRAVGNIDYDFVALSDGSSRIAVFREGKQPPLRGSMIALPGKRWLLYTKGHIPFFGMYPGPHVPRPLEIIQHVGNSMTEHICKEILMLTKMNWNSANFASYHPITLQFARQVGAIMKEAPEGMQLQHKYMYYM